MLYHIYIPDQCVIERHGRQGSPVSRRLPLQVVQFWFVGVMLFCSFNPVATFWLCGVSLFRYWWCCVGVFSCCGVDYCGVVVSWCWTGHPVMLFPASSHQLRQFAMPFLLLHFLIPTAVVTASAVASFMPLGLSGPTFLIIF